MSDTAWTALGFAAITVNLLALTGREFLRKSGERSTGPVPFLVVAVLCFLWAYGDSRPAIRRASLALGLAGAALALWPRLRYRRTVLQSPSPGGPGGEDPVAPPVRVYTMTHCPYCLRAKELLRAKGTLFAEVNLDDHPERWEECERLSGRKTVPQVFLGERHLGGCDDLLALEKSGELDRLLGG